MNIHILVNFHQIVRFFLWRLISFGRDLLIQGLFTVKSLILRLLGPVLDGTSGMLCRGPCCLGADVSQHVTGGIFSAVQLLTGQSIGKNGYLSFGWWTVSHTNFVNSDSTSKLTRMSSRSSCMPLMISTRPITTSIGVAVIKLRFLRRHNKRFYFMYFMTFL